MRKNNLDFLGYTLLLATGLALFAIPVNTEDEAHVLTEIMANEDIVPEETQHAYSKPEKPKCHIDSKNVVWCGIGPPPHPIEKFPENDSPEYRMLKGACKPVVGSLDELKHLFHKMGGAEATYNYCQKQRDQMHPPVVCPMVYLQCPKECRRVEQTRHSCARCDCPHNKPVHPPHPPPGRACGPCVAEFKQNGGCKLMRHFRPVEHLIPPGCYHCGHAAEKECGLKPEQCEGCMQELEGRAHAKFMEAMMELAHHGKLLEKHFEKAMKTITAELKANFNMIEQHRSKEADKIEAAHKEIKRTAKHRVMVMQKTLEEKWVQFTKILARRQITMKQWQAAAEQRIFAMCANQSPERCVCCNAMTPSCQACKARCSREVSFLQKPVCSPGCKSNPEYHHAEDGIIQAVQGAIAEKAGLFQKMVKSMHDILKREKKKADKMFIEHSAKVNHEIQAGWRGVHDHESAVSEAINQIGMHMAMEFRMREDIETRKAMKQQARVQAYLGDLEATIASVCGSIKHAEEQKEVMNHVAHVFKNQEQKLQAQESHLTRVAKHLAKRQYMAKKRDAAVLKEDVKKAAKASAYAAKMGMAADIAVAARRKAAQHFQTDQKKKIAALKRKDKEAVDASEARLQADHHTLMKLRKAAKAEMSKHTKAMKKATADQAKYAHEKMVRNAALKKKQRHIAQTLKRGEKALDKKKAALDHMMDTRIRTNQQKAAAKQGLLKAEAKLNARRAAAAQNKIKFIFRLKKKANQKKQRLYKMKEKFAAKALKKKRGMEALHKRKIAAKADEKYAKAKAKADAIKKKAQEAMAAQKAFAARAAAQQHAMDQEAAAAASEDAAMKECKEGQCEDKDHSCHYTDNVKRFFACDGYSCADKVCKHDLDPNYYTRLAGVKDVAKFKQFPPETKLCKSSRATFEKRAAGLGVHLPEGRPHGLTVGCAPTKTRGDLNKKKNAVLAFFAMMATCNPYCVPGTETYTSNGAQDSHGICTSPAMMNKAAASFKRIKNRQDMGTNGKIKANPSVQGTEICSLMHATFDGFMDAAGQ